MISDMKDMASALIGIGGALVSRGLNPYEKKVLTKKQKKARAKSKKAKQSRKRNR